MALNASQVGLVMDLYRGRSLLTKHFRSAFPPIDASQPDFVANVFSGLRNVELYLEPFINAPFRGILTIPLESQLLAPLLEHLLPILASHAAHPPPERPVLPLSQHPGPGHHPEILLDRLANPAIPDEAWTTEAFSWLRCAEFCIETYRNAPLPTPQPLPLASPALDPLRSELTLLVTHLLRQTALHSIVKIYADAHPG